MRAYMVQSNKKLEPFGEHPRDCLIANRKLSDIQEEVLKRQGLTLEAVRNFQQIDDPNEYIVFEDSLLFSDELFKDFMTRSRKLQRPTVCSIKPPDLAGVFDRVISTQEIGIYPDRVEYGLRYMPNLSLRGEPVPLLIDLEQHSAKVPVPEHAFGCPEVCILLSDRVIVQIDHWVNLHNANMMVLEAAIARLLNSKTRLLGAALKAFSLNQWRLLQQTNKIGKNCNIHPTAWIDASILGDNVTVGAGSIISGSLLAGNNLIENNTNVHYSVLGERSSIGIGATARFSLLYPGAAFGSRLLNYAVCGRDALVPDGVVLSDYRIDGKNISVMKNGTLIDTGSRVSGACLGHGVYLGAGCIVGPGRAIPNGMHIAPERSRYIGSWDSDGNIPGHQRVIVNANPQSLPPEIEKPVRGSLLRRILRLPSLK